MQPFWTKLFIVFLYCYSVPHTLHQLASIGGEGFMALKGCNTAISTFQLVYSLYKDTCGIQLKHVDSCLLSSQRNLKFGRKFVHPKSGYDC